MSLYLDVKYVNMLSSQLERFSRKGDYLWNFRCPICGDSVKSKSKARGYIFRQKNDLFFKCHNCGAGKSVGSLLKFLNTSLYNEYVLERYSTGESSGSKSRKKPEMPNLKPKKLIKFKLHLPNISELPDTNVAVKYLKDRKLPEKYLNLFYYAEDFQAWAKEITNGAFKSKYHLETTDPRIVIPFLDKFGNLVAIQARAILPSKIRYITIKFDEEALKIFGLERWSSRKKTYVLEGPFDSLFLPNALAMAGSSVNIDSIIKNKNDVVYVFDNEKRNIEIVRLMSNVIHKGYNICIWPATNEHKDINDMILSGLTESEILNQIEENTKSGLEALLALNSWKRC